MMLAPVMASAAPLADVLAAADAWHSAPTAVDSSRHPGGVPGGDPGVFLRGDARVDPLADFATPEFQVNTHIFNDQRIPAVAADPTGNILIVWQSRNQDGPGWGVHGQRLNPKAEPVGEEFRVNAINEGSQDGAQLVFRADGSSVVSWLGPGRTSGDRRILIRAFAADGSPSFADREISDGRPGLQLLPSLTATSDGRVLVGWEGQPLQGQGFDALLRYLSPALEPVGPVVQANQFDQTPQRRVDLAAFSDGRHVAAWQSSEQDGSDWAIVARCMDFGGGGADEFLVNQTTIGGQARPRVAVNDDDSFLIVWQDNTGLSSLSYQRVMARLYASDCTPLGPERQVNQFDERIQDLPEVGVDGLGHYIVVWQSFPDDFDLQGIYARRIRRDGAFLGDEFKVSQEVEAYQDYPVVAGLPDGGFIVSWETIGQDGSGFGIYARRYLPPQPAELIALISKPLQAVVGEALDQALSVRVLNQWGEVQPDAVVRFSAAGSGPGLRFANGLNEILITSDADGLVSVDAVASGAAGAHSVRVCLQDNGICVTLPILNAPAPVLVAVPLDSPRFRLVLVLTLLLGALLSWPAQTRGVR